MYDYDLVIMRKPIDNIWLYDMTWIIRGICRSFWIFEKLFRLNEFLIVSCSLSRIFHKFWHINYNASVFATFDVFDMRDPDTVGEYM